MRGNPLHKGERRHYLQYLAYLATQLPPKTEQETFEAPYYDRLQVPLQPLADNLESQVYETFEKDPVKYSQYEEATYRALRARRESGATVMVVRVSPRRVHRRPWPPPTRRAAGRGRARPPGQRGASCGRPGGVRRETVCGGKESKCDCHVRASLPTAPPRPFPASTPLRCAVGAGYAAVWGQSGETG